MTNHHRSLDVLGVFDVLGRGSLVGRVDTFDEHAGYGEVEADDGRRFFFHCTQIADGSRTIDADAVVRFSVRPWHQGSYEAVDVEKR